MTRNLRDGAVFAIAAAAFLLLATSASPTITPSGASNLATALASDPSVITGASLVAVPPNGTPNAIADSGSALAGFPTNGSSYTILSSGDATLADDPNSAENSGASDGGDNVRGDSDFDVTILKIDLDVPAGRNCLTFDFRFLSDEFQEFVGSAYNDAFIAELDTSNWSTSGSDISAPNNFAFDPSNNVISINAAGATSMTAAAAAGTTYDGATPLLSASTPITAGAHSLYLSIFDQGDAIYDSAVFLDRLFLGTTSAGGCTAGATVLTTTKTADSATAQAGASDGYTITVSNPSSSAVALNTIFDVLPAGFSYVPGSTTGPTTADPTISGQTLTWTGPFNVPANGNVQLHFNVTVSSQAGQYFNNAGGTASGSAVSPTGDTAPVTVTAGASADLSVSKTDAPDPVAVGADITYTLAVHNGGPDAAANVAVTDVLPAGASFKSASPGCLESAGTVTCTIGSLAANGDATATITVTATQAGPLTNTATVASSTPDPTTGNNSSTTTTTVNPANHPPVCGNVTASPSVLWPPNHKLVLVTLAGASDPDGDAVAIAIGAVSQDEPLGFESDALAGSTPNQVWLRAERDGSGDGRVYRIGFTVIDGKGGSCTGVAIVGVPHDKGNGAVAIDSGTVYDSFTGLKLA